MSTGAVFLGGGGGLHGSNTVSQVVRALHQPLRHVMLLEKSQVRLARLHLEMLDLGGVPELGLLAMLVHLPTVPGGMGVRGEGPWEVKKGEANNGS